jgi:formate dehydrogenase major subunit
MYKGKVKAFFCDGRTRGGWPNAKLARAAMQKLEWLVSSTSSSPRRRRCGRPPALVAKDVPTEVFFIPAAPAAEKDGSLTNTMRLIQWHEKSVNPPVEVLTDAHSCALSPTGYRGSTRARRGARPRLPRRELHLRREAGSSDMELVLKEINGFATEEITDKDGKVVYKKNQPLNTFAHMTDDGKTASGCWIYTGVTVKDRTASW